MGNTKSISFKDLAPIDYTGDYLDDDGFLNYQIIKRKRNSSICERTFPYRRMNPRRLIERAERRSKRPYLNLIGGNNKITEAKKSFDINNLDSEFITRAENNPSLNLVIADFQTIKGRKMEIQYLIKKHFFPDFDLSNTIDDSVIKKESINRVINTLKKYSPEKFELLFTFRPQNIGPGEALIYFIYNKAILGGGSKSGDIFIGDKEYEVKAVKMKGESEVYDFRLGGTIPIAEVMKKLVALSGKDKEISGSDIANIKMEMPKQFNEIENKFAKLAYDHYFSKHDIIFFNNGTSDDRGSVIAVKQVQVSDIRIERVTSGIIKPIVKI
jgi:hypothetical protein